MHELDEIFNSSEKRGLFVHIDGNTISFMLQEGPTDEVGVNGCQVDKMIRSVVHILQHFNERLPSIETEMAVNKLVEAELWLRKRTEDRMARDTEGTAKP